jgi:chaperone modulatory protein CbpM
MAKRSLKVVPGELIEVVTLSELCQSCGVQSDWIVELVDEGILEPRGSTPSAWRFSAISITRTRIAWRLQHDLGVNQAGIAIALNLLEEQQELHLHLQRLERSLGSDD